MEPFWPQLPFIIPNSQGTQIWWDILWWIFQIAVMTFLIIILTRWATGMDRDMQKEMEALESGADSHTDLPPETHA
ncbi:hypothetical protein [Ferviditalea candida]|uniref:Uncharacterized protein n=1 Tax=Ferviditalea candida TaxID=3108399 RepID=A0ABU5ZHN7_9BACL|nr:hypothetical protein [Paenibacillaceae bacterium T2]